MRTFRRAAATLAGVFSRPRCERNARLSAGGLSGARALAAGLPVFAALAFAAPQAALAQTNVKLVSNTEEIDGVLDTGDGTPRDYAQKFTTGNHADGYWLTRVDIDLYVSTWQQEVRNLPDYTMEIKEVDTYGNPGRNVVQMTTADSLTRRGLVRYNAPGAGTALAANTTYLVVYRATAWSGRRLLVFSQMIEDAEDSGAAAGWSIANSGLRRDSGTDVWAEADGYSYRLAIHGRERDVTAPTLVSATVWEDKLTLTYDEALDTGSVPNDGTFAMEVDGDGFTYAPEAVEIAGNAVTVTLVRPVPHDATKLEVVYVGHPTSPIRDKAGNVAATLDYWPVVVRDPRDTTAPTLVSATVWENKLTLTYDEALDTGSVPSSGAFGTEVDGDGITYSPVTVEIAGNAVTVKLAKPVPHDATEVKVIYVGHPTNPIRDEAGNAVATLDYWPVVVTGDTTAPTLSAVEFEHHTVRLTYSEALDPGSVPAASDFTLTIDGYADSFERVAISGSTVLLTIPEDNPVYDTDAVVVGYARGANPIQDLDGNDAAGFSNRRATFTDMTPPTLVYASVDEGERTLVMSYGEDLNPGSPPVVNLGEGLDEIVVTVDGDDRTYAPVASRIADGSEVRLTLARPVPPDASVTLTYTAAYGSIQDKAGLAAAAVTDVSVIVWDNTPPTLSSVEFQYFTVRLTYDEPLDPDSVPDASDFTLTIDGVADGFERVAISGNTVLLTRVEEDPIRDDAVVVVGYTAGDNPEDKPIQDLGMNYAADFSNRTATLADLTAPLMAYATVEGATLVMVYGDPLDPGSVPTPGSFVVTVDGDGFTYVPVTVEIAETEVTLTLDTPVPASATSVTLTYMVPSTNPIQDEAGIAAAALTDWPVELQAGPVDGPPPVLAAATLSALSVQKADDTVLIMSPAFSSSTYAYAVRLDAGTTSVKVTVTKSHTAATLAASLVATGSTPVPVTIASGTEATLTGLKDGRNVLTVTVTAEDGVTKQNYTLSLTVGQVWEAHRVPLFFSSANPSRYQGFVRIVNRSGEAGEVYIDAFDDAGVLHGPVSFVLEASETVHFNTADLEEGNPGKGLDEGVGKGTGAWRLVVRSALAISVLAYNRTDDGLLTPMHDLAPVGGGGARHVAIFNPASNTGQVSRLRLVNSGDAPAAVRIRGIDDAGATPGPGVALELAAGTSRTLTSPELESGSGEGLTGRLGDGQGKWRLLVKANRPVEVMSLLSTSTGHLVNLSTVAPAGVSVPAPVVLDTTPPTLSAAEFQYFTVRLTYSEALDPGSVPAASDFTLTVNGNADSFERVAISGSTVLLTRHEENPILDNAAVVVGYARGTNPIQDLDGNDAAGFSDQTATLTDLTPPTLAYAEVGGGEKTLVMYYSEDLDTGSVPSSEAFEVTVDGVATIYVPVTVEVAESEVTLTLDQPVPTDATSVTLTYVVPSTNPIQDEAGIAAAALTDFPVTLVEEQP